MKTIRMLRTISGSCDGQRTNFGDVVTIGDRSADQYIAEEYAELVEVVPEEKAEEVVIDRSGVQTAEMAPPENAADHVDKPEAKAEEPVKRGPGRPRKNPE